MTIDRTHFTMVFEGDLRSFDKNPLTTDTPFGRPLAAGFGNAFDELDRLSAPPPTSEDVSKAIEHVKSLARGRTHYEGQPQFFDEALVAHIQSQSVKLRAAERLLSMALPFVNRIAGPAYEGEANTIREQIEAALKQVENF